MGIPSVIIIYYAKKYKHAPKKSLPGKRSLSQYRKLQTQFHYLRHVAVISMGKIQPLQP